MIVYFIYVRIHEKEFNHMISYMVSNKSEYSYSESSRLYTGLYAWTTKKKYVKQFLKERTNNHNYIVREKEIDDVRFDIFSGDYKDLKLGEYKYKGYKDKKYLLITTFNEHTQCEEYARENIYEMLRLDVDYMWFKDEYIDALDMLSYTTLYDEYAGEDSRMYSTDELDHRLDLADTNRSYGLTVLGNKLINMYGYSYILLQTLFRELFSSKLDITMKGYGLQ